ncbi:unnamed protein product [Brachionus calyciflorus]|uniref:Uncharacterized protein n=1 Tax=Brachionus calyciflorus TaxID=104777 RepID=A0A814PMH7_9BILA|nr:unnamed protein product [Brachionus calyciflorus]
MNVIASCFFVIFNLMVKERVESHRRDSNEWHAPRQYTTFSEIKREIYNHRDPESNTRVRHNKIFSDDNLKFRLEHEPMYNYQPDVRTNSNDSWIFIEAFFKPSRYSTSMEIETWWKRFEQFVRSANVKHSNLRNVLLSCLDDECMKIFENCTPDHYLSLDE